MDSNYLYHMITSLDTTNNDDDKNLTLSILINSFDYNSFINGENLVVLHLVV